MNCELSYCIAIRTLGKAGEKYQKELDSLVKQTIPPKKILVYLAEGYERPKETVGVEEIIYSPKGMVSQRARDYKEVDTPYVLMLDDDVYLPPTAVEQMMNAITTEQADCVVADTFPSQRLPLKNKLLAALTNWATPHFDQRWGIKIGRTTSFSYLNNPKRDYYPAQNGAGPCSLWRLDALKSIHLEHELWLDKLGFAYGDEMFFFHKLYRNGGKLLIHYTCGAEHLDAQSSRTAYKQDPERLMKRARSWFILWWRTQYEAADLSMFDRILSVICYTFKVIYDILLHLLYSIARLSYKPLFNYLKGLLAGYRFVHTNTYRNVPNFCIRLKV